jgi:2-haloacid dehalogenase
VIDFDRFEALTFDCYGTLVDWERGILSALRPLLGAAGESVDDDELLERFGRFESEVEAGAFSRYREVLAEVARRLGAEYGALPSDEAVRAFAGSVSDWPVFPDTVEALGALTRRYRLAVVSNVDDDLFAGSAEKLGVEWAEVVTAEQVGSYKPASAHFDEALRRLDLPRERVLHVAQSLYHDIAPAKTLGFTCVWVDRRGSRGGSGATPPAQATPDLRVPDLATLATAVGV